MNYTNTVNWMFKQLPMYQNQGKSAYKKDLNNIKLFAKHLSHPERQIKTIHVAGTNGKGSTCHLIASILQEAGYKVGLFTSPHLKDFRERIKINGKKISEYYVTQFVDNHYSFLKNNSLSFFEMTTGMAFDYFCNQKTDIAIIEVGLGGRLDSTNIIVPEISVITNIGLDHKEILGSTLEAIAIEKAGIIKPGTSVVIGESQSNISTIFKRIAKKNKTPIYFADKVAEDCYYLTDLKGDYQQKNILTALMVITLLNQREYFISNQALRVGLLNVENNTGLKGRWQILQNNPKIIIDTAHNREGLSQTMQQLQKESFSNLHIVFGVVNDKDFEDFISLMPIDAIYYFSKPNNPRGVDAEVLQSTFKRYGFIGNAYNSVYKAFIAAKQAAKKGDVIYVGGSTFVVAEII